MAIDTRDKRASMIGLGLPFVRVLPNPESVDPMDLGDRQQMLFMYRGIAVTAGVWTGQQGALRRGRVGDGINYGVNDGINAGVN